MDSASSVAYSSSANLGPGYDVLALCHDAFINRVTVSYSTEKHEGPIKINGNGLPDKPAENTAGLSLLELLKDKGITDQFTVSLSNNIPTGLGLGASGASAAASVNAMDALLNLKLTPEEKVKYAMLGECASSGSPHPDNVSASIYGGLVMVQSVEPVKVRKLFLHRNFSFLTVMPELHIENKTKVCRQLVPYQIPMDSYITGIRYLSNLVIGLTTGDREMVREGMNDMIVEAARKPLYPYYDALKNSILKNNAVGVCISGAGPSVLAIVDKESDTHKMVTDARNTLAKFGMGSKIVSSKLSGGAYVST